MPDQRKGYTEPRVWTPPLRELTPETSLGYSVIDFAKVLGITLYPYQEWVLIHGMELLENGRFRFRRIFVLVGRQNGKTRLETVIALWFLYVYPRLRLVDHPMLVVGTAQDLAGAIKPWDEACTLQEQCPSLARLRIAPIKQRAELALRVAADPARRTKGGSYSPKAANDNAGRGGSADVIFIDELRQHKNWASWNALSKTMNARPNGQLWALSNAGDVTAVVLRHFRKIAHAQLGDPDGLSDEMSLQSGEMTDDGAEVDDDAPATASLNVSNIGIFDYSAPPGAGLHDPEAFLQANPACGYGIVELDTLIADSYTDPEDSTRIEVLCQWLDRVAEGIFPGDSWEKALDPASNVRGEKVTACVDMSHDRALTTIVFAGRRADGLAHVEVVARKYGKDWVRPWLAERKDRLIAVTGQAKGAAVSELLTEWAEADDLEFEFVPWEGADLAAGHAQFHDAVRDGLIRHLQQPWLDVAVATAVKRDLQDGNWVVNRAKSPADASPLVAAIGSHWLLEHPPAAPFRSRYEDEDIQLMYI